jgi:hypothetical protein
LGEGYGLLYIEKITAHFAFTSSSPHPRIRNNRMEPNILYEKESMLSMEIGFFHQVQPIIIATQADTKEPS